MTLPLIEKYRAKFFSDIKGQDEIKVQIKNFYSIGRQGQFYYGDIDQMIRIGFDPADKIIRD